ncbi:Reticulocyte-binding protein 2 a [Merluccius polli]|uniref:Reticulocyte-binding protein 2 a n=1 Tax=Merluccius polli TaxID=89951 RepID=A0AA47M5Y0_MERPO|nr:Reticulocyte-binding protein 2 a [Merluccius polli]
MEDTEIVETNALYKWSDEETRSLIQWRTVNASLFTGRRNAAELKCPRTGVSTEGGETIAASWKWYTLMDEAIGDRPSVTPPVLIASSSRDVAVVTPPPVLIPERSMTSTPKRRRVNVMDLLKDQQRFEEMVLEREERKQSEAVEREERRHREAMEKEEARAREAVEKEEARAREAMEREEARAREVMEREDRRYREAVEREERLFKELREREERRERELERRDDRFVLPVLRLQQVTVAEADVVQDRTAGDDLRHIQDIHLQCLEENRPPPGLQDAERPLHNTSPPR